MLDLQPGVPESDIKLTYRKKSLLIHPDKTTNPQAPDAFDRLKKASTELMDEKHREYLDSCIADARMLLIRERKLTVDSEELKTEDFKKGVESQGQRGVGRRGTEEKEEDEGPVGGGGTSAEEGGGRD